MRYYDNADKELDEICGKFNHDPNQKRCPFCGGSVRAWWRYTGDYDIYFYIECDNCICKLRSESWEELIGTWNKRATNIEQAIEGTA